VNFIKFFAFKEISDWEDDFYRFVVV